MNYKNFNLRQVEEDLGINASFIRGQNIPVKNCWHFSTNGDNVQGAIFQDAEDFKDGMNRVFILSRKYKVIILAFVLMDTHVHFLLYGNEDECTRFMYEFIRRTSMHIAEKHGIHNLLENVKPDRQDVDNDFYLKIVICYIMKNPPVAGLGFRPCDYPWGSGPLYFRQAGYWCSANSSGKSFDSCPDGVRQRLLMFKSTEVDFEDVRIIDGIVFPGEYVAVDLVEKIFRNHKSLNSIMSLRKEDEVENTRWKTMNLSIPIQEMRDNKKQLCMELYGQTSNKNLDTAQRLKMAKVLRKRYNSSPKQIARLCGLIYKEVQDLL